MAENTGRSDALTTAPGPITRPSGAQRGVMDFVTLPPIPTPDDPTLALEAARAEGRRQAQAEFEKAMAESPELAATVFNVPTAALSEEQIQDARDAGYAEQVEALRKRHAPDAPPIQPEAVRESLRSDRGDREMTAAEIQNRLNEATTRAQVDEIYTAESQRSGGMRSTVRDAVARRHRQLDADEADRQAEEARRAQSSVGVTGGASGAAGGEAGPDATGGTSSQSGGQP